MRNAHTNESGFSLVELMIVILIICLVVGLVFPRLTGRDDSQRLMVDAASRVKLRRREARRLAPQSSRTGFLAAAQPPVAIDFSRPATTAPLRIDGVDANGDGVDDARLLPLTRVNPATGLWDYAYEDTPLTLPSGWRLAAGTNPSLPAGAGLIKTGGGQTAGIPVYGVAFDSEGRAYGDRDGDGTAEGKPDGLVNTDPGREAPFWALYFTNSSEAFAVAVHATGLVEMWKWDARTGWAGWQSRTPEN